MTKIIGIIADTGNLHGNRVFFSGERYLQALTDLTDLHPILIPPLGGNIMSLLDKVDGVMLTGNVSNVHPSRYGQNETEKHPPYDEDRDSTAIPYLNKIIANEIPLIAICRGFQELNVAYGGTLHPAIHEIDGRLDHRRINTDDAAVRYAPRHSVKLTQGGLFESWVGTDEIMVNSLHFQGVEKLGDELEVEAVAEDGTVEGFTVKNAKGFTAAVQWHPEYEPATNKFSKCFYEAFAEAVLTR